PGQTCHGATVVLDPHRVGSGLPRRAVAAAGVYPRSFQPVRVVARCPGGRRGVPRRVRARRRRVGYGSPACARRCSLLPRSTTGQAKDASYPSEQLLISGEKETQDQVYFIKQIESLGNACGTIALLHAVGNASSKVNLVENSCLDLFFKSTATMDPYERAVFLEKDDTMARAHLLAANDGATELSDLIEEHYVCFVYVNGTLYELDGMKDGPIKHGPCSSISLLQDVVPVIKAIMCNIPNSINFNLMVLSRKEK
uniref:ubiquitinyl hydrolase 1 n=2 Tax=Zea mays TaxID=4577 RepID=A0A804RJN8_MAIZE